MATSSESRIEAKAAKTTRKEKLLHIPKTLREGWAEVTRSTPSSPESKPNPFRTANELSRSVNFLLNVHETRVESALSGSSGSSAEEISTSSAAAGWADGQQNVVERKASLQDSPKMILPEEFRPRRSSMSRLFDGSSSRRSQHSSAGNLLAAVLSKTLRKKYVWFTNRPLTIRRSLISFPQLSPLERHCGSVWLESGPMLLNAFAG